MRLESSKVVGDTSEQITIASNEVARTVQESQVHLQKRIRTDDAMSNLRINLMQYLSMSMTLEFSDSTIRLTEGLISVES